MKVTGLRFSRKRHRFQSRHERNTRVRHPYENKNCRITNSRKSVSTHLAKSACVFGRLGTIPNKNLINFIRRCVHRFGAAGLRFWRFKIEPPRSGDQPLFVEQFPLIVLCLNLSGSRRSVPALHLFEGVQTAQTAPIRDACPTNCYISRKP